MIRNRTKSDIELWSLVVGLSVAFLEGDNLVILETNNPDTIKEWEDWKQYLNPNNKGLIQQFEQRKNDLNLVLKVNVVSASENLLARYLAHNLAANRIRLVLFRRMFGRMRQIWMLDMGLGLYEGDFRALTEDEYDDLMMEADEKDDVFVEISDDEPDEQGAEGVEEEDNGGQDVQMVPYGANNQGMGQHRV